jgi:biopolymer transport protein ExbD
MAITSGKKIEGDETVHHQSPSKKRKKKGMANMQPPLTPMIDVTFQLLLFFILTCEFRESEGMIPGTLPSKGNVAQQVSEEPPPDPIQVKVMPGMSPEHATYEMTGVGTAIPSPAELFALLKQRQERVGSKEVPVVILPMQDVAWGFVVEAFNQAKRAEFKKIGFAQQT